MVSFFNIYIIMFSSPLLICGILWSVKISILSFYTISGFLEVAFGGTGFGEIYRCINIGSSKVFWGELMPENLFWFLTDLIASFKMGWKLP